MYGRAIQFANRQIDLAYGNAGRPVLTSRLVPKSQLLRPTVDRYDYRLCRTNTQRARSRDGAKKFIFNLIDSE